MVAPKNARVGVVVVACESGAVDVAVSKTRSVFVAVDGLGSTGVASVEGLASLLGLALGDLDGVVGVCGFADCGVSRGPIREVCGSRRGVEQRVTHSKS